MRLIKSGVADNVMGSEADINHDQRNTPVCGLEPDMLDIVGWFLSALQSARSMRHDNPAKKKEEEELMSTYGLPTSRVVPFTLCK